jgi:predicted metalloendopeptidase
MRDANDVAITIAEFVKYRVPCPVQISTQPSEAHSRELRLWLGPCEVTLPDSSYYTVDAPGRTHLLEVYNTLLTKLGDFFEINNMNLFVGVERIVAAALEETKGEEQILMKGSELISLYPNVPWQAFAKTAFAINEHKFNTFKLLVVSPTWLKYLNQWFKTWTLDNWRIWLSGTLLVYALPFLPPPFDDLHFDFFDRRLRGQTDKIPQHLLGLKMCKKWLSAPLGKKYIQCCINPDLKQSVMSLANEILDACIERLKLTEWLEPATRLKAIKKVKNVFLGIAYPDQMPPSPKVNLNPEEFIKNIFALGTSHFENELKRANTILQPEKWEDAIFEVNAYYYNEGNRLIIPAGILNYPFYDIESSDGWNFGGIGATIGHEITHAFDMDGKDYDENGNNAPWWTAQDNRNYNQKTKNIIALFNKTHYFGQSINGTLTLSENIADLGGLALAMAALKARLERKKTSKEDYKKEVCNFFISYAVSWRTKEKRKKAIQSLITDMHSPPQARVNNIVRQFDDWYDCFDIEPGNPLYTAPHERIRIF